VIFLGYVALGSRLALRKTARMSAERILGLTNGGDCERTTGDLWQRISATNRLTNTDVRD